MTAPTKTAPKDLNPKLVSKDLATTMQAAAEFMRTQNKRTLYPEAALLALIRSKDTNAARILDIFHEKRGVNLDQLERTVKIAVETRRDVDGDLLFATAAGDKIPLSRQMIIALDEALSVAQAGSEVYIDTDHLLAVFAESKFSTGGLLRQYGITPAAMTDLMTDKANAAMRGSSATANDVVADAQAGTVRAVHFREALLKDLVNMISQKVNRHVILIGPDGVGKRTLVYSLGLWIAEGKGPLGITKLITIEESALLPSCLA